MTSTATAPRVLALDLSLTATGIAVPDGTLDTLRPGITGDERLNVLRDDIAQLLDDHKPDLVTIEGPVTRSQAATAIGMLQGAIRVLLRDHIFPYVVVPPATLKTYATGRGNAPKPDLRMALYKRTGLDVADDNQVDAAWLRYLGLDLAGHSELTLPASHRRALAKLTLPEAVAA